MNAGNGMVAFLSWLLAILRGPSGPPAPSWRGQHGFASVIIPLHSSPGAFLVFCPISPVLQTPPMAMCTLTQSWLRVLFVLLLLPVLGREIAQAQPSPQRSSRHIPFLFLVIIHPCG